MIHNNKVSVKFTSTTPSGYWMMSGTCITKFKISITDEVIKKKIHNDILHYIYTLLPAYSQSDEVLLFYYYDYFFRENHMPYCSFNTVILIND